MIRKIRNPRSFEKCRSCGHYYISHTDYNHKSSFCHSVVNKECQCKEWLPTNNLEFLEWKYDRQLAIKSSNQSNEDMPS